MLAPTGQLGERFWANWLRPAAVAAEERRTRDAARHWLDFVGLVGAAGRSRPVCCRAASASCSSWRA